MGAIGRSCTVCGARVPDGQSRCPIHRAPGGALPRPCVVCGRPGPGNYCPDHADQAVRTYRSRQEWRAEYNTATYRAARKAAKLRAGNRCETCGRSAGTVCERHGRLILLDTHHKAAIVDGGGAVTADDLIVLCRCCCHAAVTSRDRRRRGRRG